MLEKGEEQTQSAFSVLSCAVLWTQNLKALALVTYCVMCFIYVGLSFVCICLSVKKRRTWNNE